MKAKNKSPLGEKLKRSADNLQDKQELIQQLKPKKKKFGKPVIISFKPNESASRVPDLLLQNNFCKTSQDANDTIGSTIDKFGKNSSSSASSVIITVGPNICPLVDKQQQHESPKSGSIADSTMEKASKSFAPRFYSSSTQVVCILQPPCKFHFEGKIKVQVLYGAVEIYGSRLDKSQTPVQVFSSRESSAVCIETSSSSSYYSTAENSSSIWDALATENFQNLSNALQTDLINIQSGWAVLLLQNLTNNLTRFLETYLPTTCQLFPSKPDFVNYSWTDEKRAENILQANIYPSEHKGPPALCFKTLAPTMERILGGADCSKQKILIAGGKNVGKSTTMRYIINRLLEKSEAVIVLDLDPGQPEFTIPGCCSINIVKNHLLGPSFTHLATTPYLQYFLGSVDIMRCLKNYTAAVRRLVDHVQQHPLLPVVVNTMGFTQHIGWDLMRFIIKTVVPTDIIQLQSRNKQTNFQKSLAADTLDDDDDDSLTTGKTTQSIPNLGTQVSYQLHTIQMAHVKRKNVEICNITPKQKREIILLAYTSGIVDKHESINAVTPYEIPFSAVKVSMGQPVSSQILSIMNGNVVALCGCNFTTTCEYTDEYPQVLVRAPLSPCYGFGIVRGVDMDKKMLYINTPLPLSQFKHINCLIGSMPVPSGLMQLNKLTGTPYVGGSDGNLPTSRDPRRGHGQKTSFPPGDHICKFD